MHCWRYTNWLPAWFDPWAQGGQRRHTRERSGCFRMLFEKVFKVFLLTVIIVFRGTKCVCSLKWWTWTFSAGSSASATSMELELRFILRAVCYSALLSKFSTFQVEFVKVFLRLWFWGSGQSRRCSRSEKHQVLRKNERASPQSANDNWRYLIQKSCFPAKFYISIIRVEKGKPWSSLYPAALSELSPCDVYTTHDLDEQVYNAGLPTRNVSPFSIRAIL